MSTDLLVRLSAVLAILLTSGALFYYIKKRLLPRSRILGTSLLVALPVLAAVLLLDLTGVSLAASPAPWLLVSFFAFLAGQRHPVSKVALCRALALVAGITAFLAAWANDLGATAVSLGVTGLLIHLADRPAPVAEQKLEKNRSV